MMSFSCFQGLICIIEFHFQLKTRNILLIQLCRMSFLKKVCSKVYDDLLNYFSQALYLCSFVVFGDLSLSYSFDQKMSIAFQFSQSLGGRYQQNISRLKYLPRRFS